MFLVSLIYRWGNWGTKLPKVTSQWGSTLIPKLKFGSQAKLLALALPFLWNFATLVVKKERKKRLPDGRTVTENLRNLYLLKVVARVQKPVPKGYDFSGRRQPQRHVSKLYKATGLTGLDSCLISWCFLFVSFFFLLSFEVRLLGRSWKLLFLMSSFLKPSQCALCCHCSAQTHILKIASDILLPKPHVIFDKSHDSFHSVNSPTPPSLLFLVPFCDS